MKLPDLPEEVSDQETGEPPKNPNESIIYHTEISDQPDNAFKKFFLLFKRKPSMPTDGTTPEVEEMKPTGPKRSSGQGLSKRVKSKEKNPNPDMRLRAFMSPPMTMPPQKTEKKFRLRPNREMTRRAYWDVAAALSLIVNAILVGALFVMYGQIRNLKTMMNGLLGGLYSNFVEMDKASISTTIPVEAQIPIVFNLPIQQNTTVRLTAAVPISGTQVSINSGGLSINAPATVTLPEGTDLPIALNLDIPVQVTIPISLQVPVNIPMNQTTLHAPFTGLQQTIRPLYCTINKNAQYPQGIFICAEHVTPSAGTP